MTTRDVATPIIPVLPPDLSMEQLSVLCARLQRIAQALPQALAVDAGTLALRLHLADAEGGALVIDEHGRTQWNAHGDGLAFRAMCSATTLQLDDVARLPDVDAALDADDAGRTARCYVPLAGGAHGFDRALLELRTAPNGMGASWPDVARALWWMTRAEFEPSLPERVRSLYRVQALTAIETPGDDGRLPPWRARIGRSLGAGLLVALLCLPAVLAIPVRSSATGQGRVVVANAPAQIADRAGRVVALGVAPGQRVARGQVLFWLEEPQAQQAADAAYQRFAATARERLLDPGRTDDGALADRLADLRASDGARRIASTAAVDGTVRELPQVGALLDVGGHAGFVMPDRPRYAIDAQIEAIAARDLRVGDSGRIRVADGREWPVRIDTLGTQAVRSERGPAIVVRATLLQPADLPPDMPVDVQFDGRARPIYRQWLRHWGRTGE